MIRIAPIILAVVVAGCISVSATELPNVTPHSRYFMADRVDVRFESDEIPSSCERIALLNGKGDADWTGRGGMLEKFREKAGELGANVVQMRGDMEEPGTGARIVGALFGTSADRRAEAIAYYCADPPPGGASGNVLFKPALLCRFCTPTRSDTPFALILVNGFVTMIYALHVRRPACVVRGLHGLDLATEDDR